MPRTQPLPTYGCHISQLLGRKTKEASAMPKKEQARFKDTVTSGFSFCCSVLRLDLWQVPVVDEFKGWRHMACPIMAGQEGL